LHALPRARFAHGKQLPWLRDGANQESFYKIGFLMASINSGALCLADCGKPIHVAINALWKWRCCEQDEMLMSSRSALVFLWSIQALRGCVGPAVRIAGNDRL
ncbi:hypothetical protein, partial [Xanthomonas nasturtii]|uniref:hypothetical protein n=1 Tax=Xanthomonas nasturtii TaxID=1843581 RepID=UPI0020126B62